MLKISETGARDHSVTLKLEGRLVGPWVEELCRICEDLLAKDQVLKLELSEVSYADPGGVAALNHFKSRGVFLRNCSPFVEQQIKTSG
jgi:ABC-type transporter Mla MlaB component